MFLEEMYFNMYLYIHFRQWYIFVHIVMIPFRPPCLARLWCICGSSVGVVFEDAVCCTSPTQFTVIQSRVDCVSVCRVFGQDSLPGADDVSMAAWNRLVSHDAVRKVSQA